MALTPQDIGRIANLARLELNPSESERMLTQLNGFFDIVEKMRAVDTSGLTPLAHPVATIQDVADLLAAHLPEDHPLASYPARLREVDDATLLGFLTGSIDAVLRVPDPERYVVVDYKTNRLGVGTPVLGHYTPESMAEAMMASHYPLQALLYAVALHRFLTARLEGYEPRTHLGGVLYLFVRGLGGPGDDALTGVFEWEPTPALVIALSHLLAGVPDA